MRSTRSRAASCEVDGRPRSGPVNEGRESADAAAETSGRHRFRRAALVSGLLGALVFFWMVNAGQLNPFHAERFGNFYDVQAHSLLHLHWDVPAKQVAFEGFLVDGKTYVYFGPVPALLRLPVVAQPPLDVAQVGEDARESLAVLHAEAQRLTADGRVAIIEVMG